MTDKELKKTEFQKLYNYALSRIGEPGWCYVADATMTNYSVSTDSDFELAAEVLSEIEYASQFWQKFLDTNIRIGLHEAYIKPAVAVAIAIKVFLCPDVEILLGFETSRYRGGESDYWYAISRSAKQGVIIDKKESLNAYKDLLKKGKEFSIEEDGNFQIVNGVLMKYKGSESKVVIPDSVTEISSNAFEHCRTVEAIILSDSVKTIKSGAFCHFHFHPKEITLSANLTKIGKDAFTRSFKKIIPAAGTQSFQNSSLALVWEKLSKEWYQGHLLGILLSWLYDNFELIKNEESVIEHIRQSKTNFAVQCIIDGCEIAFCNLLSIVSFDIKEIYEYITYSEKMHLNKIALALSEYKLLNFSETEIKEYEAELEQKEKEKNTSYWKNIFDFVTVDDGVIITQYNRFSSIVEVPEFIGKNKVIGITNSADRMLSKTVILPDDTVYCPVDSANIYRVTYKNQSDDKDTIDIWQVKNLKDGTLKIVAYCDTYTENVKIPESINGKKVTVLGKEVFKNHKEIKTVVIPSNVTEIETECFVDSGLNDVCLSEGLKIIGTGAFCKLKLNELQIPASVEKIGMHAITGIRNVTYKGNKNQIKIAAQ